MSLGETFYDEKQKIWHGPDREPFFDFNCSLGNVLFTFLKRFPKNVCQVSDIDGSVMTNEAALNAAIQIATFLKKEGYNHEDIVGVVAKNGNLILPLLVGCFFNGTPFHAVNPIYEESIIRSLYNLTKPNLVFCDGGDYEKVREATKEYNPKIFTIDEHIDGVPKITDLFQATGMERFYTPERLAVGGDQTVAILCSSGTTGLPKAVCMNRDMIFTHLHLVNCDDVIYSPSSMDWLSGILMFIWGIVGGCRRIVSNKPYTPEHFVHLVKTYKVTITNTSPTQIALLLGCPSAAKAENFDSVKFMSCGGSAVSVSTLKRMQALLTRGIVAFGYGLSEVGNPTLSFGLPVESGNCVGKLLPGFRMRIVDESGNNLGPNEKGEIWINSGRRWPGYYKDPVASKQLQDEDGWIRTGDIGYFDDRNLLFVVDRIKDTLKYRGEHYFPGEIEDVIMKLPDVVDVCVLGDFHESDCDRAAAVVVKKEGSELTEQEIIDYVAKQFSVKSKHLNGGVVFADYLPQNKNGKKLKAAAREIFEKSKL